MITVRDAAAEIDALMEQASAALVATSYFEAERLCLKALARARASLDFDRLSRIVLPLQEARRQRRHEACDAGHVFEVRQPVASGAALGRTPGLYLIVPPMVGLEGRRLRALLDRRGVPSMVLAREPATSAGRWPIVAVGDAGAGLGMLAEGGSGGFIPRREPLVVRVQVDPPAADGRLDSAWFLATQEALGDAAIARVVASDPPDHRVDDLLEALDAVPDHEKISQALASACREACAAGPSGQPRRRPAVRDRWSF